MLSAPRSQLPESGVAAWQQTYLLTTEKGYKLAVRFTQGKGREFNGKDLCGSPVTWHQRGILLEVRALLSQAVSEHQVPAWDLSAPNRRILHPGQPGSHLETMMRQRVRS